MNGLLVFRPIRLECTKCQRCFHRLILCHLSEFHLEFLGSRLPREEVPNGDQVCRQIAVGDLNIHVNGQFRHCGYGGQHRAKSQRIDAP
ncbi:hypothetical protein CTI14_08370 [Methylobacterium radiotolerans]|nr:hypothetical protein CTI14_08370 [Methylobacterium radiotolerans]